MYYYWNWNWKQSNISLRLFHIMKMRFAKMLSSLLLSPLHPSSSPVSLYLAHCIRILFLLSLLLCFISFYFIFYSCIYLSQTVVLCCRYIHLPVRILFYFILYNVQYAFLYIIFFGYTCIFIYLLKWYRNKWIWIFTYTHSPANGDNSESIQPWLMNKWQMANWKSFFSFGMTQISIYLYGKKEIYHIQTVHNFFSKQKQHLLEFAENRYEIDNGRISRLFAWCHFHFIKWFITFATTTILLINHWNWHCFSHVVVI